MRQALEQRADRGVEFTAERPRRSAGPRGGLAGDGRQHLVASYFPIRIADTDELVGFGFTVVDVTERTRLLEALGAERARYERLAATDVLAVFGGEEERITEANEAFLALLGYTAEDVAQGRLTGPTLTPPDWAEADARALAELADSGRARAYDKEYRHADGHRVPVQIGVVALERKPLRWLAYATDLSAERAAQAELRLFQALVERSGDFIAVAAPDGRAVYVEPGRSGAGRPGRGRTGRRDAPGRLRRAGRAGGLAAGPDPDGAAPGPPSGGEPAGPPGHRRAVGGGAPDVHRDGRRRAGQHGVRGHGRPGHQRPAAGVAAGRRAGPAGRRAQFGARPGGDRRRGDRGRPVGGGGRHGAGRDRRRRARPRWTWPAAASRRGGCRGTPTSRWPGRSATTSCCRWTGGRPGGGDLPAAAVRRR